MTIRVSFHWRSYKYFPYERKLAFSEVEALTGFRPIRIPNGLLVESDNRWQEGALRSTYFQEAVAEDGTRIVPLQTALEASNRSSNTKFGEEVAMSIPKRQNTRYSAHGLHDYRGRFNPQIVRAIGNIIGLSRGEWVLDPFCGCGTTLLEAAHIGWNAIGIDLNPLGVEIARAKIAAMHVSIRDLLTERKLLHEKLSERVEGLSFDRVLTEDETKKIAGNMQESRLASLDYLKSWFTKSVLAQLTGIVDAIEQIPSKEIRLISRVIMSDILREVSLQDPADLRVRRRKLPRVNEPAVPLFLSSLKRKTDAIVKARVHVHLRSKSVQKVFLADARRCAKALEGRIEKKSFSAAITSPPYATALPYVDTQRLSLVFFGLIKSTELRTTERGLIGNREISIRERTDVENIIETKGDHGLPKECLLLCRRLLRSVGRKDGFRRRNVPSLVFKYFADMRAVLQQVHEILRPGGIFALVIGSNRTQLGGKAFVIDTPRLLAKIAQRNDFNIQEVLPLNTYQRFDMHMANSIRSESLILLRR